MNFTCAAFGIVFIAFGAGVFSGLIINHMHEWTDLSEEEKSSVRIDALCRNMGVMIMLAGVIFLVSGLFEAFRNSFFLIAMIIWFVVCAVDVYQIEKKQRYMTR